MYARTLEIVLDLFLSPTSHPAQLQIMLALLLSTFRDSFSSITLSPLNQASVISHLDYYSTSLTSLFVSILGFSQSILNMLAKVTC